MDEINSDNEKEDIIESHKDFIERTKKLKKILGVSKTKPNPYRMNLSYCKSKFNKLLKPVPLSDEVRDDELDPFDELLGINPTRPSIHPEAEEIDANEPDLINPSISTLKSPEKVIETIKIVSSSESEVDLPVIEDNPEILPSTSYKTIQLGLHERLRNKKPNQTSLKHTSLPTIREYELIGSEMTSSEDSEAERVEIRRKRPTKRKRVQSEVDSSDFEPARGFEPSKIRKEVRSEVSSSDSEPDRGSSKISKRKREKHEETSRTTNRGRDLSDPSESDGNLPGPSTGKVRKNKEKSVVRSPSIERLRAEYEIFLEKWCKGEEPSRSPSPKRKPIKKYGAFLDFRKFDLKYKAKKKLDEAKEKSVIIDEDNKKVYKEFFEAIDEFRDVLFRGEIDVDDDLRDKILADVEEIIELI